MWFGWAKAPSFETIARDCAHPQESFAFSIEHVPGDWPFWETAKPWRVIIERRGVRFYMPRTADMARRRFPLQRFKTEAAARRAGRAFVADLNRVSAEMFARARRQPGSIFEVRA